MCLFIRQIPNPRYKSNKKNGGIIPAVIDDRVLTVPIPCGNCEVCRKKKAREWQIRLQQDIKDYSNGQFVTLTFSNEAYTTLYNIVEHEYRHSQDTFFTQYSIDNAIAKLAVRRFLERWRKKYKKSIRHWLVTELGHKGSENIHLHGILYTEHWQDIKAIWQYGYVWDGYTKLGKRINYVTEQTVNYMTKYVNKIDKKHQLYKSIILCTAGIGSGYTKTTEAKKHIFNFEKTDETFRTNTGHKMALPKYWKNKLFTDEERELLWIQKLNLPYKYINKERIYNNTGDQEYLTLLKWHRQRNTERGYGGYKINWKRAMYEKETRIIKQRARIINASGGVLTQDIGFKRDVICENTNSVKTTSGIMHKNQRGLESRYKVNDNNRHISANYIINEHNERKKK